jgi:ATP-dependent 26S proteasome regulatory subunit
MEESHGEGKSAVIKTSTRQTIFLPVVGLVSADKLKPGQLVGTNKDSYLVLERLPAEYDSRVKAMEVDEKPTEEYSDVGGLDKQVGLFCVVVGSCSWFGFVEPLDCFVFSFCGYELVFLDWKNR